MSGGAHVCLFTGKPLQGNIKHNWTWKFLLFSSTVCIHPELDQTKNPQLEKRLLKFHFRSWNPHIFKEPSLSASFRCSAKSDTNVTWTRPVPSLDPTCDQVWILFGSKTGRKTDSRWSSYHFLGPGAGKKNLKYIYSAGDQGMDSEKISALVWAIFLWT